MNRAQKVNEENVVISLFIMFTSGVMVIKMSRKALFFYILLMTANN